MMLSTPTSYPRRVLQAIAFVLLADGAFAQEGIVQRCENGSPAGAAISRSIGSTPDRGLSTLTYHALSEEVTAGMGLEGDEAYQFFHCFWACELKREFGNAKEALNAIVGYGKCFGIDVGGGGSVASGTAVPDDVACEVGCSPFTEEPTPAPTLEPTPAPTDVEDTSSGRTFGDPHFVTLHGDFFSYHGECDLVLLSTPSFADGLGLDIHVRTERRGIFSFVSNAAVRIGEDVLEVKHNGSYFINGEHTPELPAMLAGKFQVTKTMASNCGRGVKLCANWVVNLGGNKGSVHMHTKYGVLFVSVDGGASHFTDSQGLLGAWGKPGMIARDGVRNLSENPDEFGQEWQVLNTEASLFENARFPQFPDRCLPPNVEAGRNLEQRVDMEFVANACSHVPEGPNREFCMFDVMATGDLEMVQDEFYTTP